MDNCKPDKGGRKLIFAAVLMAGIFLPPLVNARGNSDIGARVNLLEFQTETLSRSLSALSGSFGASGLGLRQKPEEAKPVLVAQARDIASINLRLSRLEEQMRVLVGQMEGLQFQMTQYQTLIERMRKDNDFRFKQLEGTNSGKTEAAPQPGGVTLPEGVPQNPDLSAPIDLGAPIELGGVQPPIDAPKSDGSKQDITGQDITGPLNGEFVLGSDFSGSAGLSPGSLSGSSLLDGSQGPDLGFDPGSLVTSADADAQYRAGYEAVVKGDYQFAETQFRQFIALFPNHPQAPDATNWLGEALLQRGQYDEAAQVLFKGFQAYKNTTRAPDLLLKLGIALAGAGERDTACRTFGEVLKRFPDMGGAFNKRVKEEMSKSQC
ncbi:hypothetical protein MNBD_ALPHA12-1168 [hydrothermal vent metagenome]|uniref:Uncharacterized protein n=1 Tax=hydrothermal vent metagenome TaxID=652676 RepID=A0A3B0UC04_9ZZZZ